jgi:hypothetical protein
MHRIAEPGQNSVLSNAATFFLFERVCKQLVKLIPQPCISSAMVTRSEACSSTSGDIKVHGLEVVLSVASNPPSIDSRYGSDTGIDQASKRTVIS